MGGGIRGGLIAGYSPELVAPGRRKLFVDAWDDSKRQLHGRLRCPLVLGAADFGLDHAAALVPMTFSQLDEATIARLSSGRRSSEAAEAMRLWAEGCAAMEESRWSMAGQRFDRAMQLVPRAPIYGIARALVAAGEGDDLAAMDRLRALPPLGWNDVRIEVAQAMIGHHRGNWPMVEDAIAGLSPPLDEAPGERAGRRFLAELYFYALLWDGRYGDASDFARAAAGAARDDASRGEWEVRVGDAYFLVGDVDGARGYYQAAVARGRNRALLKLADISFLAGDMAQERRYRERIYGSFLARE